MFSLLVNQYAANEALISRIRFNRNVNFLNFCLKLYMSETSPIYLNVYGFAQYLITKIQEMFKIVLQLKSMKMCGFYCFLFGLVFFLYLVSLNGITQVKRKE